MSEIRISVVIDLPFGSTITVDGNFDERTMDEILAAFSAYHSRAQSAELLTRRLEESND